MLVDVLESRSPFRCSRFDGKGMPPKTLSFEKEFAAHQGTKYCIGVTSGTAALITALAGLGIGPGDEVILPAWTWYACYDAILFHGALPVFAEIDRSMDIDPTDIYMDPQYSDQDVNDMIAAIRKVYLGVMKS
jgi:dTDP-4-amino-4,6-dideoxygalactose transaminase